MSTPQMPTPARMIISIIFSSRGFDGGSCSNGLKDEVISALESEFGQVDYQSEVRPFTQTSYYEREMGEGLSRVFVSFNRLIPREQFSEIKLITNAMEKKYAREDGSRRCNIDPGFLSVENFILVTGKNFTHRIFLKDGIFAEVTLLFQAGKFQTLPWTYWDYAAEEVITMLSTLRKNLITELIEQQLL